MGKKKPPTVKHPAVDDSWRQDFRAATFRTSFMLALSQSMVEYLSAVADGVTWDRCKYSNLYRPDSFLATQAALVKRGLIVKKTREEFTGDELQIGSGWEWSNFKLTPAGEAVVQLFRVTGVFVEADAAITKKLRG